MIPGLLFFNNHPQISPFVELYKIDFCPARFLIYPTVRRLFVFNIGIGVPGTVVCAAIGHTTLTHTVRIDGNLNAVRNISDTLHLVYVPNVRGLLNAIFQEDNAIPHVASSVLTFLDIQDIRLLPWSARFLDLSLTEKI